MEKLTAIISAYERADLGAPNFNVFGLFSSLDPEDDVRELRKWALERGLPKQTFDRGHRAWRIEQTLGERPTNVEHFVALHMVAQDVSIRFNGMIECSGRVGMALDHVADLGRDLRLMRDRLKLGEYRDTSIRDALDKWTARSKQARVERAIADLIVEKPVNADAIWNALAVAFADPAAVSTNYVIRAVQTFMWQVKRKLANEAAYPVYGHLMPVLTGPQNSGKSSLSNSLFAPIADMVAPTTFSEVTDSRNIELWRYPVLFLDEMERADRSAIESIKNAITRQTSSGRVLHTNNTGVVANMASFWGVMNGALGDNIVDTTGMRRFAPIACKAQPNDENISAGLAVVDWAALNEIDYLSLWRSVDHRADHPLLSDPEAEAEWRRLCEAERSRDSVEEWLRQVRPDAIEFVAGKGLRTSDLYRASSVGYKEWCEEYGYKPFSVNGFGRKLRSMAASAWYPFYPPEDSRGGTIHVLKATGLKLAA